MLKKLFFKLSVLLDTLKGIVIFLLVWALIIFFGSMIIHNVLKMGEQSNTYQGEYKTLVEVDTDKMMNVVVYGEGEKTIVILPGFGMQSPVIQYKAIADKLKENYKVAIVEYYGYGYSMNTDKERTLDNIATEVKTALAQKEINEFILMPHSLSNIYAMRIVQNYPESVKGIVSIDGLYPAQYKESYFYDAYLDELHNVELTSLLEWSGFARILSYVKPDMFYINQMVDAGIWGRDEVSVLRNRIALSYLTDTMVEEREMVRDNSLELQDYKYPDTLPVVQILASETVADYAAKKKDKLIEKDLEDLANQMISNSEIQSTVILEGNHDMEFTNYEEIANLTRELIDSGKTDNVQNDIIEVPEELIEEPNEEEIVEENKTTSSTQIYNPSVKINNTVTEKTNTISRNTVIVEVPRN